jgi:hypothetical protein
MYVLVVFFGIHGSQQCHAVLGVEAFNAGLQAVLVVKAFIALLFFIICLSSSAVLVLEAYLVPLL